MNEQFELKARRIEFLRALKRYTEAIQRAEAAIDRPRMPRYQHETGVPVTLLRQAG